MSKQIEIIFRSRYSGKTWDLITKSAKDGGCIVCRYPEEVYKVAQERCLQIRFPISYDCFIGQYYYGKGIEEFYIDDAEILLQHLTHVKITAITMSTSEKYSDFVKEE